MSAVAGSYRKQDPFLGGQNPVAKKEIADVEYFHVGPEATRDDLPFDSVFPIIVSGPTTLNEAPNATEDEGENTEVRRGDREKDWTNGTGGWQKYRPGAISITTSGDDWINDEKQDVSTAPIMKDVPSWVAPVTEPPPPLDGVHAGDPSPFTTGDWLGVEKHGAHDQKTHGNDESSGAADGGLDTGTTKPIAGWASRSGKHDVRLMQHSDGSYSYRGNGAGGVFYADSPSQAIATVQARVDSGDFLPDNAKTPMRRIDPAAKSLTANWLDVAKHGQHDQSTHGHDESTGDAFDGVTKPGGMDRAIDRYQDAERPIGQPRTILAPSQTLSTADRDDKHVFVTSPEGLEGPAPKPTASGHRPLYDIANDVATAWKKQSGGVNYAARPYLEAMADLADIRDTYGADSARSVVAYFLSNASTFRGPEAQRLKGELKGILSRPTTKSLTLRF